MTEWEVTNLRSDYEYATIELISSISIPFKLLVKHKTSIHGQMDFYKTLQGAKSAFTKNFQSPKWGKEYPTPIWEQIKK